MAAVRRIALLRFHGHVRVCRDRLELLHRLNPALEVHALFGGRPGDELRVRRALAGELASWFAIRDRPPGWKWLHGDLAIREWFRRVGRRIEFDVLHVIEWDLVLAEPLTRAYALVPRVAVGLTGLTPLSRVAHRWWWTTDAAPRWLPELDRLRDHVARRFGRVPRIDVCQGPGTCLPRAFVERYAAERVPALCHDEVRLPLFARALGFRLRNTGFLFDWYAPLERSLFNCQNEPIPATRIARQLRSPTGKRAFHPVREPIAEVVLAHSGSA